MAVKYSQLVAIVAVIGAGAVTISANTAALGKHSGTGTPTEEPATSTRLPLVSAATSATGGGAIGVDDLTVIVVDSATQSSAVVDPVAGSPSAVTYEVGVAGAVTVDRVDGEMRVIDLSSNRGWTAADPDDGSPESVYSVFSDGMVIVEFRASYADGGITPSLNTIEVGS